MFCNKSDQSKTISKEVEQLAEELHNKLCHSDHVYGCWWYYDTGNWSEPVRIKYAEKASKILEIVDLDTAMKIVKCI